MFFLLQGDVDDNVDGFKVDLVDDNVDDKVDLVDDNVDCLKVELVGGNLPLRPCQPGDHRGEIVIIIIIIIMIILIII